MCVCMYIYNIYSVYVRYILRENAMITTDPIGYTVYYTVYSVQCTLYSVHCAMYNAHCIM